MNKLPRIGTRVRVSFGFDKVEGEVIDAYDSGARPYVRVAVELGGPENTIVDSTFPLDQVEAVDAA